MLELLWEMWSVELEWTTYSSNLWVLAVWWKWLHLLFMLHLDKALDSLSIEANSSDCLLQITFETNACVREEWMSLSINKTLLSNSRFTWSTTGVVVNLTNLTNLYVLGRNVAVLLEFKPPNGETHPISLRLNSELRLTVIDCSLHAPISGTFCDSTSSSISTSSSLNSSLLLMVAAVAVIFTFVWLLLQNDEPVLIFSNFSL